MSILKVTDLTKIYPPRKKYFFKSVGSPFVAVDGISFSLKEGEILGFLGPNGAGKTTTMHMLLGILTPTSGSITYFGKNLFSDRSEILSRVGFASAYMKFPSQLTVNETLHIFARLYGLSWADRVERVQVCLKAFDAWDLRNKDTIGLSAGQITKVMLAKAFLPRPKVLLLDEPTASLDPDVAYQARYFIHEQQKKHGASVLFASHNMAEVTQLCDRVIVLQHGHIIASDTPKKLAATVSSVRIELEVVDGLKRIVEYAQEHKYAHAILDRRITIELDEHKIAPTLAALAQRNVSYSYIAINKPSLEDYFLKIAAKKRKGDR
jgi:ABC-2 type transport system ATP-binding protein